MNNIIVSEDIKNLLPDLILGILEIEVNTSASSEEVSGIINNRVKELEKILSPEIIREMDTVKANKDAYRKLGKDPTATAPLQKHC